MITRILITTILWIPTVLFAQSMTLKGTLQQVLKSNLSLQQQSIQLQQLEKELRIQRAQRRPQIQLQAGYQYISEVAEFQLPFPIPGQSPQVIQAGVYHQYDVALQIQQPLFTGFRIRNAIRLAEEELQAAQIQYQQQLHRLLFRTGQLYLHIQQLRLQQSVLQQNELRVQSHLQTVKQFYRQGQATALDTLQVATRLLELQQMLQELKHREIMARTRLAQLLGMEQLPPLTAEPVAQSALVLEDSLVYLEQARTHRPELQHVQHLLAAAVFQQKTVRAAYLPQIFARASYHYARPGVNFFQDEWMTYYTAGIQLRWNLWSGHRHRYRVQKAHLQQKILRLKERQLWLTIRQVVVETYQQLKSLRDKIRFQRQRVQQEKLRYRLTRQKFQEGLATSRDLSESENGLLAAEFQLQELYIQWKTLSLQLEYVTGTIAKRVKESS
ncbi:MAG: TolC family protein [Calditrichaeota bacterium]|nr:TolC family protein [Calditrichota bacterium]